MSAEHPDSKKPCTAETGYCDNPACKQHGCQRTSNESDICAKCGWSLQACDCCGLCGEPSCDCAKELNGDQSEPLGYYNGDEEVQA